MDGSAAYYYEKSNALVGRNLTGIVHPSEPRYLSIREIIHLMGMPHNFEFSPSKPNHSLNFLAQNVPSCTARDMTFEVLRFLSNDIEFHDSFFLKQDNLKQTIVK